MKLKKFKHCLFSSLLFFSVYPIYSQNFSLKSCLWFLPSESTSILWGADLGLEAKIKKNFTAQASLTFYGYEGDEDKIKRKIWSLQARKYTEADRLNSFYYGAVLQKRYEYVSSSTINYSENKTSNKIGTGIITGIQEKLFGSIGIDIHMGLIGQFGKEHKVRFDSGIPMKNTIVDQWKLSPRFIWGFNLYLALGKLPSTNNK